MAATDYNDRVRALFAAPAHAGEADGIAARAARGGFTVEFSASLCDGCLERLRFRVFGCPHLVAAAEAFCDAFEGRPSDELAGFNGAKAFENLEIPVEKTGRILLLEDAARALHAKAAAAAAR